MLVQPLMMLALVAGSAARERLLMGTTCGAEVVAVDEATAARRAAEALDEIERWEPVLSTWSGDAELARLNARSAAGPVVASRELFGALQLAFDEAERSGGAFDPTVGALVDAWDLRGEGRIPSVDDLARARASVGFAHVILDAATREVRFDVPGLWIDSGGFGKGWALARADETLRAAGTRAALLDFGGQLLAIGHPQGERAWLVGVADPRDRQRPVLTLRLRDASASTSAQSERSVEVAGRHLGHVLDPRSGEPLAFEGSATVVHRDAARADALSTALLVLSPDEGLRHAEARHLTAAFLVPRGDGLELIATPSFLRLVADHAPDVHVRPTRRAHPGR